MIGRTVVMPAGARTGCGRSWPTGASRSSRSTSSEFHKGGGSVRCLTNPVDVTLGRDLPLVAGGEVVLPRGSV